MVRIRYLRPAAGAGLGEQRLGGAVGGNHAERGRRPVHAALADDRAVVRHLSRQQHHTVSMRGTMMFETARKYLTLPSVQEW